MRGRPHHLGVPRLILAILGLATALVLGTAPAARAELQFDVFFGFDDHVREGHWFPVAFEILNDGPTFIGTVAIGPETGFESQMRTFTLELPSGTRKRVVIPLFSSVGRYSRWEARLLDPSGKLMGERTGLQPKDAAATVPILGAIPRTFGGLPSLPEVKNRAPEFLPGVARLQVDYLPTNPIALDGLSALYLNSERAADLKPEQIDCLLAWIHGGGHLVVGIEQPGDITALPWLQGLLPFAPETVATRMSEGSFERWLVSGKRAIEIRSLMSRPSAVRRNIRPGRVVLQPPPAAAADPVDPFPQIQPQDDFNNAEIPIVSGRVLDGERILSLGDSPLIISAARGLGTVTALAFSPEREPYRSWKNRSWFWAKLISVPPALLVENESARWSGTSIDALFGAMLDSRQVRKLPVVALLLLLVVYLGVIGPFDQWILKRTGKQMWTWVTFPCYVVLFSGLIYFIGYRLRAGDLEWNELQIVDQLPRPEGATLRGRTWVSIYSPANARYRLASEQPFATIRSEFQQGGPGRGEAGRLNVRYPAKGFDAEAFVPVWVSQLYAADWLEAGPVLLRGKVEHRDNTLRVVVQNQSALRLGPIRLVYGGRTFDLGTLAPNGTLDRELSTDAGESVDTLLASVPAALGVVQQRRYAFGSEGSGQWTRNLNGVLMASLAEGSSATNPDPGESFSAPSGFDINPLLTRGEAVLFAWAAGQTVGAPIHRFSPRRATRDTVLRIALPVVKSP